jgi:hypothetical protein
MTATLSDASRERRGPASHRARRPAALAPAGRVPRGRTLNTPATLRALLAGLVLLALAWGAFGGWVASQHSSAAAAVVTVDEPLSLDAQQMFQAIADADVTITEALLASSEPLTSTEPPLSRLQRYQADIATAASRLAALRGAGGNQAETAALDAIGTGLPEFTSDIAKAQASYAFDKTLTGGSFLQVAAEETNLVLLPNAKAVFTQENDALAAASGQATDLATIIAALVLAVITAVVLYRAQRWLARRTNRVLSVGLALTSVLLVGSALWLAASFLAARSHLDHAIGQGSGPAANLALADIDVQQIRGDSVLNVISRSGNTSFLVNFQSLQTQVGPGPGSLLSAAAAAQGSDGNGASLVAAAEREAPGWYTANETVYSYGKVANYDAERTLVIGSGVSTGYDALVGDLTGAIDADRAVFTSAATSGQQALEPLEVVVIVAALLMAIGCGWAFSRRLAEYR